LLSKDAITLEEAVSETENTYGLMKLLGSLLKF